MFFFFSIVFRNDLNSRPVQISVHINNTNNFNFAVGQEATRETDANRHRNEMNINTVENGDDDDCNNNEQQEENDSTDDNTTDEDSTEETNQTHYPTPPNSEHDQNVNRHQS